MKNTSIRAIVYFDGFCHLCNGFVNFLLKIDKNKKLLFSPLQGTGFSGDTVVFDSNGKFYFRSAAVIEIFVLLGGMGRFALIFYIIPAFIRDFIYSFVAKNRFKIWGKRQQCRVPTEAERKRFL